MPEEMPEQGVCSAPPDALTARLPRRTKNSAMSITSDALVRRDPARSSANPTKSPRSFEEVCEVIISRPPDIARRELKATASLDPERHMLTKVIGIQFEQVEESRRAFARDRFENDGCFGRVHWIS
jgi:hypothetical protein